MTQNFIFKNLLKITFHIIAKKKSGFFFLLVFNNSQEYEEVDICRKWTRIKEIFIFFKVSFSPTAPTPPPPIWTLFETAKSRPIVCLPSFRALWSQISLNKLSSNWKRTTFWYVNCARKICAQNISQQFFKEAIWQIIIKKKIFWQSKEELLLLQGVK